MASDQGAARWSWFGVRHRDAWGNQEPSDPQSWAERSPLSAGCPIMSLPNDSDNHEPHQTLKNRASHERARVGVVVINYSSRLIDDPVQPSGVVRPHASLRESRCAARSPSPVQIPHG